MTPASTGVRTDASPQAPAWGAVAALTLGVFGLVTAEFLPASLLTPMAADLGVSEGAAGQAVTATATVGMVAGLGVSTAARRFDRRTVLVAFCVLLTLSNVMVAWAPNLPVLLAGRVLLGVGLGGFWALSAAVVMRLVPEDAVPRALSVVFSGVSAATVVAAPLGSFLGDAVGWRNVFLCAAGLGLVALVAQAATLPRMPPQGYTRLRTLLDVAVRPGVGAGIVAITLVFAGHFALFTYIRPFLETVTAVGVHGLSAILLGFGVANFLGTYLGGLMIERSLRATLVAMPLVMAALALSLAGFGGGSVAADAAMMAAWGLAFGGVPVAWSTWLTRVVPDEAESAGGLLVAAVQLAIAAGAAGGGLIFDAAGTTGVFTVGGAVLVLSALTIVTAVRTRPQRRPVAPAPADAA